MYGFIFFLILYEFLFIFNFKMLPGEKISKSYIKNIRIIKIIDIIHFL